MALAVIHSLIGILLMLTLVDENVRGNPPAWYIFHITAMIVLIGVILHPFTHAGLINTNTEVCFLVIYGIEYIYFALGMSVIVYDIEIYFSKILNLQKWEQNYFSRFLISILFGWVVVCLLVAHLIINKNERSEYFCYIMNDETWRNARTIVREILPAILCFIFTIVLSVTYYLKRSRFTFMSTSGELREVRSDGNENEAEWLRCSIFLNSTFIARSVAMVIINHHSIVRTPNQYRSLLALIFFHVEGLYTMPCCLFFISDIRAAFKKFVLLFINKASFGKLGKPNDREDLAVSFGNVSQNA